MIFWMERARSSSSTQRIVRFGFMDPPASPSRYYLHDAPRQTCKAGRREQVPSWPRDSYTRAVVCPDVKTHHRSCKVSERSNRTRTFATRKKRNSTPNRSLAAARFQLKPLPGKPFRDAQDIRRKF